MPDWRYWSNNWKFGVQRAVDDFIAPGRILEWTIHRWESWDERVSGNLSSSRWHVGPRIRGGASVAIYGSDNQWRRFRSPRAVDGSMTYELANVIVDPFTAVPWTEDKWILGEVSAVGTNPRGSGLHARWRRASVGRISHLATVVPPTANYYHFLVEILPRALSTLRAFPDAQVHFFPDAAASWQAHFLAELGIPWTPIVSPQPIRFERYVVTGHRYLDFRPEDLELLRQEILPVDTPTSPRLRAADNSTKIYIPRRGSSRVPDWEPLLIRELERLGWVIFEPEGLSLQEQARLFDGAGIVLAPTGAGLANTIWSRPETTIVGLFLPNLYQGIVWDSIAEITGASLNIVPDALVTSFPDVMSVVEDVLSGSKPVQDAIQARPEPPSISQDGYGL